LQQHGLPTANVSANSRPASSHEPRPRFGVLARLVHYAYGAWVFSWFATLMAVAAVLAFVLPVLAWRRALVRNFARFWLALIGVRVHTTGLDALPSGSCVLVANHSSYLDGVVMQAVLPPRFSFVVKREAASTPVLGLLLRRIGAEFVDRHTPAGRQRDARRVVERAEQGHSLLFFPEGTFDSTVGLKRFHIGAFVAAARGGVPVVPTVIHGARRALPSLSYVPRPGRIHVEVLLPVGGCGEAAERLRDLARARMLERLDEPDLAPRAARVRATETVPG
jgi:1-acyl-sn-glycerol-3-phosphate acyltransferase